MLTVVSVMAVAMGEDRAALVVAFCCAGVAVGLIVLGHIASTRRIRGRRRTVGFFRPRCKALGHLPIPIFLVANELAALPETHYGTRRISDSSVSVLIARFDDGRHRAYLRPAGEIDGLPLMAQVLVAHDALGRAYVHLVGDPTDANDFLGQVASWSMSATQVNHGRPARGIGNER